MNLRVYHPHFDNIICPRQDNKLVSSSIYPFPSFPRRHKYVSELHNVTTTVRALSMHFGVAAPCADSCLWGMNQRSLWSTRSISFLPRPGISLVPSCRHDNPVRFLAYKWPSEWLSGPGRGTVHLRWNTSTERCNALLNYVQLNCSVWVWNLVADTEGRT